MVLQPADTDATAVENATAEAEDVPLCHCRGCPLTIASEVFQPWLPPREDRRAIRLASGLAGRTHRPSFRMMPAGRANNKLDLMDFSPSSQPLVPGFYASIFACGSDSDAPSLGSAPAIVIPVDCGSP